VFTANGEFLGLHNWHSGNQRRIFIFSFRGVWWINIWGVLLLALTGAWWQRPERPGKMFNKTCFLGLHGGI
jgi:hypothetical protein